jgi:hypothetical protein
VVIFGSYLYIYGRPGKPGKPLKLYKFMGVGAADKAAIQRVKVPPYQLLVSDT